MGIDCIDEWHFYALHVYEVNCCTHTAVLGVSSLCVTAHNKHAICIGVKIYYLHNKTLVVGGLIDGNIHQLSNSYSQKTKNLL